MHRRTRQDAPAFLVNGTATNNNNTLVDGAVNINIGCLTTWLRAASKSIETVNVTTGCFDAEQAWPVGPHYRCGQVRYQRFPRHRLVVPQQPALQQRFDVLPLVHLQEAFSVLTIFGGNLGGPIRRTSCFFVFNYERTAERTGYYYAFSVAPPGRHFPERRSQKPLEPDLPQIYKKHAAAQPDFGEDPS